MDCREISRCDDSRSEDSDSAGSLQDFIVNDEYDGDVSEGGGEGEDEPDDEETTENVDDEDVRNQYTPDMETKGIVHAPNGLIRSTRCTRGKKPVYYVDEGYTEMMLDDVGSDLEHMSSYDSEETYDDPDDGDFVE